MTDFIHGKAFIEGQFRVALAKVGHRWIHVVFIDGHRVRVKRVRQVPKFFPIEAYSMARLAKRLMRRKNCLGLPMKITKGARRILQEATS